MRRRRVPVLLVPWIETIAFVLFPWSGQTQTVEATIKVGAQPCAVAVNVFTNQVIEANCLGDTVVVISVANNSATAVSVGSRPVAIAVNPITNNIYAANSVSNSVSVIDGNTLAATTVTVGANPRAIAVNEVTNQIYVANNSDNTVTIIDGSSNQTTTVNAGTNPIAVAINQVTNQIYVSNLGETVTIIDGATNQTTSVPVGVFPQALAVNPITNHIYVANSDSDTVTVINGTTQQTSTLSVGLFPVAIAINPATNQIYVADNHSLDIKVIDGLTGSTTTVNLGDNPGALTVDASSNQIYVASASGIVTVIDGSTNRRTATVPVGANPAAVAVNPVTDRVYTADSQGGTVTAIDAANDQSVTLGLGTNPLAVGTNPVTNQIYVCNADDNTVSVIDGVTDQSTTISVGTKPSALAVNPVSNQVYIANTLSNSATIINGLTGATTTVDVGVNPTAVAVNPVTNWAYVVNSGSATVTAINGTTSQTTTLKVGVNPGAVAVNPVTGNIYVANRTDGTVTVIDGVTGQLATVSVGVNPNAIAVDSATNQIYVANSGSNSVSVIDGATNHTTSVTVGLTPVAIAVNPWTNQIYVANSGSGTVTVIAGGTNRTKTLTVGSTPIAIAVNPVTNHIYIANAGSDTVTVIDGLSGLPTSVLTGTNPTALSIDPITGQIYVTNSYSNSLSVISEQRVELLPLTTVVSPLPGNETVERSPTFVLSASSSYAPINPPIQGVRYQIDSWQGLWRAATASGATFNATTSQLRLGPHVIYAFADNGQAGATTGLDENVVGGITGYFFAVVQGQTTTDVTSSSNPSSDAQPVTLTASVQAAAPATGIPTGTVSFLDGATVLAIGVALDGGGQASFTTSSLTPGTHSITASYTGDVNFVSSTSSSLSQTVERGQTVTTLKSSLNPSSDGQPVTLTASVQAVAPATGIPTGTVSFLDGATILTTGVALDGSGQASFTISSLSPGAHSITASYTGDPNFANSTSISLGQTVAKGQTVATLASSPNPSAVGQGATLTATVQAVAPAAGIPTGTVTFLDGATILAGVALNGSGQASFTTPSLLLGTHSISVNYAGDSNFANSASIVIGQVVVSGQTVETLASSVNPSVFGQGVSLVASVQAVSPATGVPTGTVSFFDGATMLASAVVVNGQASFTTSSLAPGTHPIRAIYSGDANFAGSASGINETVNSPQIALNLSETSLTVQEGGVGSFSFNISANGALLAPITFACGGLPANTICQFSPSSLSPGALPGKVMVNIGTNTVVALSRPRKGRGEYWYGFVVIGMFLASVKPRSRRTRIVWGITTLLLLIVLLGCGSGGAARTISSNGAVTPTGVSSVMITASSGSLHASASFTLTVVK